MKSLENQYIYHNPGGSKLFFPAPPVAGVNEKINNEVGSEIQ
jgi:hypothetical protein